MSDCPSANELAGSGQLDETSRPQNGWLRALQIVVVGLVFVLGFWQFAQAGFDWRTVLDEADPWVFFFAMATLPVFGFPISACYIYAGVAFDPWTGVAACLGALIINMSASFALTHSFFKGPLERFLERRRWRLPKLEGDNVFRFAFLVRTVPGPPFFFQNLALGLAGIRFWTYLWISLLAQGSIAVGVIYCSHALSRDPSSAGGLVALLVVGVLLIFKAAKWVLGRRRRQVAAARSALAGAGEKPL